MLLEAVYDSKRQLDAARPTAVNLMWATARMVEAANAVYAAIPGITVAGLREKLLHEAQELAEDDVRVNTAIARAGAEIVAPGSNILHHCNTGMLICTVQTSL